MNHYTTVAQPHRKNRWYVARRTLNGGYAVVAEAFNEDNASRIVSALNEQEERPMQVIDVVQLARKRKSGAH